MAFVMTWRIAVRWKNAAAPIVVPGMRVTIEISPFVPLVAIYDESQVRSIRAKVNIPEKNQATD